MFPAILPPLTRLVRAIRVSTRARFLKLFVVSGFNPPTYTSPTNLSLPLPLLSTPMALNHSEGERIQTCVSTFNQPLSKTESIPIFHRVFFCCFKSLDRVIRIMIHSLDYSLLYIVFKGIHAFASSGFCFFCIMTKEKDVSWQATTVEMTDS